MSRHGAIYTLCKNLLYEFYLPFDNDYTSNKIKLKIEFSLHRRRHSQKSFTFHCFPEDKRKNVAKHIKVIGSTLLEAEISYRNF